MLRRGLGLPCFNLPGFGRNNTAMPLSSSSRLALARPKSPCPGLSDVTKNKNINVFQSCQSSISGLFFQGLRGEPVRSRSGWAGRSGAARRDRREGGRF